MAEDSRPVVVGYDGSDQARTALTEAARLFPARRMLVVSVWEAGLALAASPPDVNWVSYAPSLERMEEVDQAEHDRAAAVAAEGAQLATDSGAQAEAIPVCDERDVASTIAAVAEEHDAAVLVVGHRHRSGVSKHLFGSTSRSLLNDTRRPVLVVRSDEPD